MRYDIPHMLCVVGIDLRLPLKVMYLDESGDHNLKRISASYPIFVLGGVIVDRAYGREVVDPALREFKLKFFGRDDVILHTVDMGRNEGDYAFLADADVRAEFYADLNGMLDTLEYNVVACAVKKPELLEKYGENASDPYMYALEILIERFCIELGEKRDGGFVCAEKRDPKLDRRLIAAWENLRTLGAGTGFASANIIDERIVGFDLRDKKPNLACMQLADLVITPIGRRVAGRPIKSHQVQWTVVERKLRRDRGRYIDAGLIILP